MMYQIFITHFCYLYISYRFISIRHDLIAIGFTTRERIKHEVVASSADSCVKGR